MKFIQNSNFNPYQRFFCERIVELVHKSTIDSYRVRVMNTNLIINELVHLCDGWVSGRVHDFKTVQSCLDETITLLNEDEVFSCITIDTKFLIDFLKTNIKSEKDNDGAAFVIKNLAKIKIITQAILLDNQDYSKRLLEKIDDYINNPIPPKDPKKELDPYLTLEKIDRLTSYLITDLIGKGYHKSYLSGRFDRIFQKNKPFDAIKGEIFRIIAAKEKQYKVWFKFFSSESVCNLLNSFSNLEAYETIIGRKPIKPFVIAEFENFNTAHPEIRFVAIDIMAFDYYSALYKAKTIMSEKLDILNLGFGNQNSGIVDRAYIIDSLHPELAQFIEVRYSLDGKYNYGESLFENISQTIPKLLQENYINEDSKEKIKSAFHYLRLGNEAIEIEHKIINYWFGLEYLFSSPVDTSFKRIITFFPKLQAISYLKRNVIDIHQKAIILNSRLLLQHLSQDFSCLNKEDFFKEITWREDTYKLSPLICYRTWFLKNRFFGDNANGKRQETINTHVLRLEQQLRRIYSVRNEIVHEARYNINNESLTSNLKYYLIFSLSVILDYFSKHKPQEAVSIDDFLQFQEVKFDYLKKEGFPFDKLIDIAVDHELLGG